ncbi:MAG: LPS export ABC transporter periplasmic protein LptC [Bacteroidota bacterium]
MEFKLWLLSLTVLLLSGCVNDPAELDQFVMPLSDEVEIAEGVTIRYSDSAQIKVVIQAPLMLNHLDPSDPYQEFPDGLHVTFFDEFQDTSSTLIAQRGIVRQRAGEVVVRDSVVWQSVNDEMLETEELIWDQREELIHTNKFVVITQPDAILYGYGFESPQNFSTARIKQVTGRVPINRPPE